MAASEYSNACEEKGSIYLAGNGSLLLVSEYPQGDGNFLPIIKGKCQRKTTIRVVSFSCSCSKGLQHYNVKCIEKRITNFIY